MWVWPSTDGHLRYLIPTTTESVPPPKEKVTQGTTPEKLASCPTLRYISVLSHFYSTNSKVLFKHQREAMDATFKWIFKRKSTLSVLGLPEDLRGSPKTLHSWAGFALHYVRWPVGGVRWCRQPGSKGKWLQSRGNTIRNYKSSSKCLTNAAYCCANFVIYKSFKFTEFTNKQLSITPSQ